MKNNIKKLFNKFVGAEGEILAANYLRKNKYKVIGAGYSGPYGEIDLIAQKGEFIVFVEVKARKNESFGRPCESVTYSKQQKIIKTAMQWLSKNNCELQPRFDVIEVYTDTKEINHVENAFEQR